MEKDVTARAGAHNFQNFSIDTCCFILVFGLGLGFGHFPLALSLCSIVRFLSSGRYLGLINLHTLDRVWLTVWTLEVLAVCAVILAKFQLPFDSEWKVTGIDWAELDVSARCPTKRSKVFQHVFILQVLQNFVASDTSKEVKRNTAVISNAFIFEALECIYLWRTASHLPLSQVWKEPQSRPFEKGFSLSFREETGKVGNTKMKMYCIGSLLKYVKMMSLHAPSWPLLSQMLLIVTLHLGLLAKG